MHACPAGTAKASQRDSLLQSVWRKAEPRCTLQSCMKTAMKALFLALLLIANFPPAIASPDVISPGAIYRCGNDYLNDAEIAQARGCDPVGDAGVAVTVAGTRVLSTSTQTPVASVAAASSSHSPSALTKAPSWRADSADQRVRDRDALSILQAELTKAEALLAERQRELADPPRHASRLGDLQSSIARHLSDVAGLKREISRLPVR